MYYLEVNAAYILTSHFKSIKMILAGESTMTLFLLHSVIFGRQTKFCCKLSVSFAHTKIQNFSILTKSCHFEERGKTSLQCLTCGQHLEIVVIRNAPERCVSACKFAFSGFDKH